MVYLHSNIFKLILLMFRVQKHFQQDLHSNIFKLIYFENMFRGGSCQ